MSRFAVLSLGHAFAAASIAQTLPFVVRDAVAQTAPGVAPATAIAPATAPKPVAAAPIKSQYTTIDLKQCKRVVAGKDGAGKDGTDKDGGRWTCGGPKGFEILFAEGDLRQFLSYGAKAREQRAASQTLGPFNSIFKDDASAPAKDRTTVQWRGTVQGGKFVPFATIVRYHTDTGDNGLGKRQRSQMLVVTKLGAADGADACHVAYVDAVANKDANFLAAKAADELARSFDCRRDPVVTGLKGAVPAVLPTRT
jgi:hypothetical protein